MKDSVDAVVEQWQSALPSIDLEPASTVGRIHRISRILQLRSSLILNEAGLARGEFDVLAVLMRHERPMAPTEIAASLSASPAGTTKRVQKLLAAGLLSRKPHQTDRRSALLETTPHAQDIFPALLKAITDMETTVLALLPPESMGGLASALKTLLVCLESAASEAPQREAQ